MQQQFSSIIDELLSSYLCCYRKGFDTGALFFHSLRNRRKLLIRKGYTRAVLMDLPKVFDTINHELLIAKLYANGFSENNI